MWSRSDLLVGRAYELGVLERLLQATCAGGANVVLVVGEPGIGKTHVLAKLVRESHARGCLVLEGSAPEYEQELPFGVVIGALDAYVASLDPSAIARMAADGMDELADVFPSLRSLRRKDESESTASERFRSYHAVRELLERLAAKQPLVLVLDDLHWADQASIELVAHLLRRPPEAQVLLAGSFRTGKAPPALTAAIVAAERAGKVERLELGPLAPDEAGALLVGTDKARAESLYRQSGGNPFYLLQLARVDGKGQSRVRGEGDEVPSAVVAAIGLELAGLSPTARAFAEAAAVVGDPFDLDVAAVAAAVGEPDALTSLDELITGDLLRPRPGPPAVRLPPPARAGRRLPVGAHEHASGGPHPLRGRPRRLGCTGDFAGVSHRAVGPTRRQGGHRRARRGRPGDDPAPSGDRGPVVPGGPALAARSRAGRRASRTADGRGGCLDYGRPPARCSFGPH